MKGERSEVVEYDRALAAVDRLEKAVGGDPYLDVIRAGIHLAQGDAGAARRLARQAVDGDGTLPDGYWALVNVSLADKRFDETARLLDLLREQFQLEFGDLTQIPEYAEFVQSPEYRQWAQPRTPSQNGGDLVPDAPEAPQ